MGNSQGYFNTIGISIFTNMIQGVYTTPNASCRYCKGRNQFQDVSLLINSPKLKSFIFFARPKKTNQKKGRPKRTRKLKQLFGELASPSVGPRQKPARRALGSPSLYSFHILHYDIGRSTQCLRMIKFSCKYGAALGVCRE